VKWWNLQCYAGGGGNDPQTWANAITAQIPGFSTDKYVLAGDWARLYDPSEKFWGGGDCPSEVTKKISDFSKAACFGGAFIWNMDQIVQAEHWGVLVVVVAIMDPKCRPTCRQFRRLYHQAHKLSNDRPVGGFRGS
jgi:hypothetical protein